jgi:hypothetical protein
MTPITLPVAGFRAESVLDQDRMATLWLAADEQGRSAVLTIWHLALVDDTQRSAYLEWAARLSRTAGARGVADVLASGLTADGRPYLAVETRPGTLTDRLAGGALAPPVARSYGIDLAEALAVVHAAGVVHGAVRPSTVLATDDGVALSGFGIAAPGLEMALPVDAYTPPEHLRELLEGRPGTGPAGDVYDLALTLYVALGGRPPWSGDPASANLRGQPLPEAPGMSQEFLALLRSATAIEPQARPTAAAFARMLAALDPGEATVPPPHVTRVLLAYIRRVAASTVDAAAGAVGGAAGTVVAARVFGEPAATGPAPVAAPAPTPSAPAVTAPTSPPSGPAGAATSGGAGSSGAGVSVTAKAVIVLVTTAAVAAGGYALTQRGGEGDLGTGGLSSAAEGLALEPENVDFGTVALGGELTTTVTFTNRGTEPVTPDVAQVSGEGFVILADTCAGQQVAPAGTCTLTVALHPTAESTYDGQLTLPTDRGDITARLVGSGQMAELAGTYALTRITVDPPTEPSEHGVLWSASIDAMDVWVRNSLTIEAEPGCSSPPCPILIDPQGGVRLEPLGDGTFHGTTGEGEWEWTVRPDVVENGEVVSLTLTFTTYDLESSRLIVTQTLTGTRTA